VILHQKYGAKVDNRLERYRQSWPGPARKSGTHSQSNQDGQADQVKFWLVRRNFNVGVFFFLISATFLAICKFAPDEAPRATPALPATNGTGAGAGTAAAAGAAAEYPWGYPWESSDTMSMWVSCLSLLVTLGVMSLAPQFKDSSGSRGVCAS